MTNRITSVEELCNFYVKTVHAHLYGPDSEIEPRFTNTMIHVIEAAMEMALTMPAGHQQHFLGRMAVKRSQITTREIMRNMMKDTDQ
jgi:hypothetical protein